MFLFTTPTSPPPAPAPQTSSDSPVVDAIRRGATATGTDFDYLLRTAKRESSLDPSAKAPTSSATGLFQFIEQTWLGVVRSDGQRLGLGTEAKAVVARSDGTLTVSDPEARQAILALREQPGVASAMAGALTQQNRAALIGATGREPTAGELYMAHVLGARGASDLITTAATDPTRAAALDFPEAARANRSIFFDRGGQPRSVADVYGLLASAQASSGGPAGGTPAAGTPAAVMPRPAAAEPVPRQPPGLQGLFQTGARPGPLSDAVARLWRSRGDASGSARSAAVPFFPRTRDADDVRADEAVPAVAATADEGASTPPDAQAARRALVPLPPIRPSFAPPDARFDPATASRSVQKGRRT